MKSFITSALKTSGRPNLICYITPEFPLEGCTIPLILELEKSGVKVIEIGIPFSDPLADGPTIQNSSQAVLQEGLTFRKILSIIRELRKLTAIPVVLMGYANSVLNAGIENFFKSLRECGVNGVIIPDVPLEEVDRFIPFAQNFNIDFIPLVTPLSSESRIRAIISKGSGFVYCVSVTGVTGESKDEILTDDTVHFLQKVRNVSDLPLCIGFGISRNEHIRHLATHCDGFIVGSALINSIKDSRSVEECCNYARHFVRNLMQE